MGSRSLPTSQNAPDTFFDVTPADATKLDGLQWLRVGGAGNLVIKGVDPGASAITIPAGTGEYVPFGAGFVMAATTATGIQGFGN